MEDFETKVVQDRAMQKAAKKAAQPAKAGKVFKAPRTKVNPATKVRRNESGIKIMRVARGTARRLRREDCAYYVIIRAPQINEEGHLVGQEFVANRYGKRADCPKGTRVYYVKGAKEALAAASRH